MKASESPAVSVRSQVSWISALKYWQAAQWNTTIHRGEHSAMTVMALSKGQWMAVGNQHLTRKPTNTRPFWWLQTYPLSRNRIIVLTTTIASPHSHLLRISLVEWRLNTSYRGSGSFPANLLFSPGCWDLIEDGGSTRPGEKLHP
jgi:hypothetical protein